ncbi:MAG: hypothetical protein R2991_10470 [Thermoanaerobaculia bacterium]
MQVYVQVRSRSETPYLAEAELGWPWEMGYRMPTPVQPAVALVEQSPDDREVGRITVRGVRSGHAQLAYVLAAVEPPGRLDDVPEDCRHGLVPLDVSEPPDVLEPEGSDATAKSLLSQSLDGAGTLSRSGRGDHALVAAAVELRRDRTATVRFWDGSRRPVAELGAEWRRSDLGFRLKITSGPREGVASGVGVVTVVDDVVERIDVLGADAEGSELSIAFARTGSTALPPHLD